MRWLMLLLAVILSIAIIAGVMVYGELKKLNDCPLCPLIPRIKEEPRNYTWQRMNDQQDCLYLDGQCLGAYDFPSQSFTKWDGQKWGATGLPCPISPPVRVAKLPTGMVDFRIQQGAEQIKVNGHLVSKDEAVEIFQGPCPNCPEKPKAPKQNGKPYVVVVSSSSAKRAEIRQTWEQGPTFAEYRQLLNLWDCGPDHWSLEPGFGAKDGTILIQRGDGAVLHRQESLDLATLAEALRNTRPEYDRSLDKNRAGVGLDLSTWVWVAAASGVFVLFILGIFLGSSFRGGGQS